MENVHIILQQIYSGNGLPNFIRILRVTLENEQLTRLSQRKRAAVCDIVLAISGRMGLGYDILRTL